MGHKHRCRRPYFTQFQPYCRAISFHFIHQIFRFIVSGTFLPRNKRYQGRKNYVAKNHCYSFRRFCAIFLQWLVIRVATTHGRKCDLLCRHPVCRIYMLIDGWGLDVSSIEKQSHGRPIQQ